jgi:hypothetical protein
MFRLLQAMTFAGIAAAVVACSEPMPTAPAVVPVAGAARDVVGLSASQPTASCTVTTDGSSYSATVTWSDLNATGVDFLNGTAVLAQSVFSHPLRSGTLTVSLNTAPTTAELTGVRIGTKTRCILVS